MRGAAGARTLSVSDSRRIVNVEEPAISPDGRSIAFITVTPDFDHVSYVHRLYLADVATGRLRSIVSGGDVSVPRWSPDGKRLGYVVRAGDAGHLQIAIRARSGATSLITHATNDVVDFAWRPGGSAIAFAAYDPASTRDYFDVGDNDYTQTAPVPPVHLWMVGSGGAHLRRLTSGSWTVAPTDPGGIFTSQFAWSADGRRIFYTRVATSAPGDDDRSSIRVLDVGSGRDTQFIGHKTFAFTPQPAPQGDVLAYSYPQGGAYLAQNVLHAVAGSSDTVVSRFLDRNIGGAVWMPGGQALLACGDDGPHATMWSIALEGTIARIGLGPLDITCDSYSSSTFDSGIAASVARNGSVALIATGPKRARELYYLRTLSAAPKQVTHFNDWLGRVDVGTMTQFRWDGPKGQPEDGVVTYPPNMEPGKRYPLVVFIHGGPGLAAVDSFVWESWPEAQLIASRGYVVFQPNYRGSDENGNAFMLAIARDTVRGPADDIMSGVAAVKRLPAVDASRVAVCGWSYGGLLTSWLVTQTHAWKAAVSGAAVNDEIEEYNLSVSNVQNRYYLGTSPYARDGMKIYADQSPITYASDITTPMLIWSTTGDPVVPTTMSYSLYHALLDNQRTVKFVEFVAPTHGPSNPKNTEEITTEWLNWLDKYLR